MMCTTWLISTIYEFIIICIVYATKGEVENVRIGLLLFYTINFWGTYIARKVN